MASPIQRHAACTATAQLRPPFTCFIATSIQHRPQPQPRRRRSINITAPPKSNDDCQAPHYPLPKATTAPLQTCHRHRHHQHHHYLSFSSALSASGGTGRRPLNLGNGCQCCGVVADFFLPSMLSAALVTRAPPGVKRKENRKINCTIKNTPKSENQNFKNS